MNNVLLSIKTDTKTKQDLKAFASELGISSTALVNMVIKQALRDKRVVLTTAELEPTPYLEGLINEARVDTNITHTKGKANAIAHLGNLTTK